MVATSRIRLLKFKCKLFKQDKKFNSIVVVATFQVLNSHRGLVTAILGNAVKHFYHHRKL